MGLPLGPSWGEIFPSITQEHTYRVFLREESMQIELFPGPTRSIGRPDPRSEAVRVGGYILHALVRMGVPEVPWEYEDGQTKRQYCAAFVALTKAMKQLKKEEGR